MLISRFYISKMDCSSEVELVRLRLGELPEVKKLKFILESRELHVYHTGSVDAVEKSIDDLQLESRLINTEDSDGSFVPEDESADRRILITVFSINFLFFIIEMLFGILADSMGLVADSLDMLADAFVYMLSLIVVASSHHARMRVARLVGVMQAVLAVAGFGEVVRRAAGSETVPDTFTMLLVSGLALAANTLSLSLLNRSASGGVHIKASVICTSNDVIANAGVIFAGILVMVFESPVPDLIVGVIIFALVLRGAVRILKLGRHAA